MLVNIFTFNVEVGKEMLTVNEREFWLFVRTDYFKSIVNNNRVIRKKLFEIVINSREEALNEKEKMKQFLWDNGMEANCDEYFDKIINCFDEHERIFDGELYDSYEELHRAQIHYEKIMEFSSGLNNLERNKMMSLINMLKISELKSKDRYLAEIISFWNRADIEYRTVYGFQCKDWETADRIREQIKSVEDILQCGVKNQNEIIHLEEVISKIEVTEIRNMYLRFTKCQLETLVRIVASLKQNISFAGKSRKKCAEIYYAEKQLHDTAGYFKLNIEVYERWFKNFKQNYCTVFGMEYSSASDADAAYYTCVAHAKSYENYMKEKSQANRGFFSKIITGVKGLVIEEYVKEYNRVTRSGELQIPNLGADMIAEVNSVREQHRQNYINDTKQWNEIFSMRKLQYEKPKMVQFCFEEKVREKECIDRGIFLTWIDELYPSILQLSPDNISIEALCNKLSSIYEESHVNCEEIFLQIIKDIHEFKWHKNARRNSELDELPNVLPMDINYCYTWNDEKWDEIIQYINGFWTYWESNGNGLFNYDPDITGVDFDYEYGRKDIVLKLSKYLYGIYPEKFAFIQENILYSGLEELFSEKMEIYKMVMEENSEAYCFEVPRYCTTVQAGLFENNLFVREIVLPESIRKIEKNAFKGCKSLQKVIFKGNKVEEIGAHAFEDCWDLREICLVNRCIISEYAFKNCTSLQSVSWISGPVMTDEEMYEQALQSRVHLWGEEAFSNCSGLKELVGISVSVIGERCFQNCRKLEKLEGMIYESVGQQAFIGCNKLKEVKLTYDTSEDTGPWDMLTVTIGAEAFPNHSYNTFEFTAGFKIPDLNRYTGRIREVLGRKPYDYDAFMEEQERYRRRSDFDLAGYYGYDSDNYDEDEYSREQFLDDI